MTTLSLNTVHNNRRAFLAAALFVVVLVAAAIGLAWNAAPPAAPAAGPSPESPPALWEAQGIDSYRYELQVSCFCLQEMTRPVIVEVRDGQVAGITYVDDGTAADPALFEQYDSIEDLFAILAEAQAQDPARFDVTYADETGVPLSVDIDISEQMADEEIRFTVTNFEALQ